MNNLINYLCWGGIAINLLILWVGSSELNYNLEYLALFNMFALSIGLIANNK